MKHALAIGFVVVLAAVPSFAQQASSALRGHVVDPQQAALLGVTITATNQETGVVRGTVSNSDGTYFITALAPGLYSVSAELQGFKKYVLNDVRLDLGHTTSLELQLEIGSVTESVTVTAETPLVDVTSKQLGGNITGRDIAGLPSVNGNFVGLVALLPGVVGNISTESFGSDAVSVNGQDSRNNNYMLDGANNNDDVIGQRAGAQARTPIEAIQEYQVITNQYDAEYGRTTGAIINAISKHGTNQFHGVVSSYFQDATLTAPDFFVKQNNITKPETRQVRWNAGIGGPVVKDKAHFFFNAERVQVDRKNTINIPARPEFNSSPITKDRVWNTLIRFDHQINVNHTWAVRWLRESSPQLNQVVPVTIAGITRQVTQNASREEHDIDQTIVGTLDSVLGRNRLNTLRLNFTREDVAFANPGFNSNGQHQDQLKPLLVYLTFVDQQSAVAQARVNNAYELNDTFSWFVPGRHGDHDIKAGGQYEFVGARSTAQDNFNGTFTFPTDLPFNPADPRTYPERLTIRVPGALGSYQKAHFIAAFAQDKWKFNNRLTLSLGVRYDVEIDPITERDNPAFLNLSKYPVDKNNIAPRVGFTYDLAGNGRSVVRGGYGRFYDKTHFELISGIITAGVFSDSFVVLFPAAAADAGPSSGRLPTDPFLVGGPTVNRGLLAQQFPPGSRVKNTGDVNFDNHDRVVPYADQTTFGYERQLSPNLSTSADYVHASGRQLFMTTDLNPGLRGTTARTSPLVRINPNFIQGINEPVNVGRTDYDALELQLVKRYSSNNRFRVSYTLSYSRGNTPGVAIPLSGFQILDDMHLELNEGPTNLDRRHNFVVNGQVLVPHTGGLTFSWIARALSGSPFTLIDSNLDPDRNGTFAEPLPSGTYSGSGRNPFTVNFESKRNGAYGPNFFQLDMRFGYSLAVSGQRTLELFADVFNVADRANFDNPTRDRRLTDFLTLTTLRSGAVPRTAELGFRLAF